MTKYSIYAIIAIQLERSNNRKSIEGISIPTSNTLIYTDT